MITGWALFFMIVGVAACTSQLFRLLDWIDHPAKGRKGGARA